ncbi:MAG: sulfite exporter TauE/SafE family protein [Deltaproteobacteria bacterium]|nr:sulfite exporter TauE/SafE family protein [Deltaproteobacteria bacterium]
MLTLALVLSLAIGFTLGLLGGGGSMLTLPLLLYVLHMPLRDAVPSSLVIVGATSAVLLVRHLFARRVDLRAGLIFGASSMIGAYTAARLSAHVPAAPLMGLFVVLMVLTAIAMVRPRDARDQTQAKPARHAAVRLALVGLVVGALTGLVGAGGGFVVVPALTLTAGLTMRRAVATSVLVITLNTAAALLGQLQHSHVDLHLVGPLTLAAVVGAMVGLQVSQRVQPSALRAGFGLFVFSMSGLVLTQEMPRLLGISLPSHSLLALMLSAVSLPWIIASTLRLVRRARTQKPSLAQ